MVSWGTLGCRRRRDQNEHWSVSASTTCRGYSLVCRCLGGRRKRGVRVRVQKPTSLPVLPIHPSYSSISQSESSPFRSIMHLHLLFAMAGFTAALDLVSQTVPGYTTTPLSNAAIRSPPYDCNGKDSYITVKTFPADSLFDANKCAQACQAETQFNIDHLDSRAICRFFNFYLSSKNGVPDYQVCALYTEAWSAEFADNTGYGDGEDVYTISSSYAFASTSDPLVHPVCPGDELPSSSSSSSSAPSVTPTPTPEPITTSTPITTTPSPSSSSMSPSTFTTLTSSLAPTQPVSACAANPILLCCMNIAQWSTNPTVWGNICGYFPLTGPLELIGARCVPRPSSGT